MTIESPHTYEQLIQSNHHQVLDCWTFEQSLLLDNLDYKINTDALSIKTIESPQNYVHLLLSNRHGFLDNWHIESKLTYTY